MNYRQLKQELDHKFLELNLSPFPELKTFAEACAYTVINYDDPENFFDDFVDPVTGLVVPKDFVALQDFFNNSLSKVPPYSFVGWIRFPLIMEKDIVDGEGLNLGPNGEKPPVRVAAVYFYAPSIAPTENDPILNPAPQI